MLDKLYSIGYNGQTFDVKDVTQFNSLYTKFKY